MSTKRLRWLLIIVAVELLTIIGIMIWAVVKDDAPSTTNESTATQEEGGLAPTLVTSGLTVSTDIVNTGVMDDARLFVTERRGTVRIVNSEGKLEEKPFLDITNRVKDQGEMGLLGMAFHPAYQQNHFFYVYYIDKEQYSVLARFTASNDQAADAATEKIILRVQQPVYDNHKGGGLRFGPDGFLYLGLGDGGSGGDPENRAQDKTTLLGKILRIDVDKGDTYAVPSTNPFIDEANAKPEIWAYGLRNPWRLSFDRKTGNLLFGDVGQNKYEEVNMQLLTSQGGENYGWRCYEATHEYNNAGCQSADVYTMPVLEYDHSEKQCSVTGGYVYRGTKHPSLMGKYIYGDYCSGDLFIAENQQDRWNVTDNLKTPYLISTFGEDASGELYFADAGSGSLYRLDTN